jgi:hypothetical protein
MLVEVQETLHSHRGIPRSLDPWLQRALYLEDSLGYVLPIPLETRLGDIPDQSVSADSFEGSGTGGNGTFQSFLSELIPVDSRYFVKTSINYTIKRLKTII